MSKKVILITQAKGGSGKSTLAFMLAQSYPDAVILDLDDATKTSMQQLAYRSPIPVSFLDAITKRIDRGAFNRFFESIAEKKESIFIADLGASVAEQLPKYLEGVNPEKLRTLLNQFNIELCFCCVVCGANNFKSTMEYLDELVEVTQKQFKIVAAHNKHFPFNEAQNGLFTDYATANIDDHFEFDFTVDKGENSLRVAQKVLLSGKGLDGISPFDKICLNSSLNIKF